MDAHRLAVSRDPRNKMTDLQDAPSLCRRTLYNAKAECISRKEPGVTAADAAGVSDGCPAMEYGIKNTGYFAGHPRRDAAINTKEGLKNLIDRLE